MTATQSILEVSPDQMDVIEAALHTQSKILHVQAEAGGLGALDRLNQVKTLLALLGQQKKQRTAKVACNSTSWFGCMRGLT